jgi:hypothetical protein
MKSSTVTLTTREAVDARGLSFAEAVTSPCASCGDTPCCTYLPLRTFEVKTLMDLDYIRFLLNFDGIVIGLTSSGTWSAYLHRDCRFLEPDTHACTVHSTAQQPSVCRHYNPYTCWYRPAMDPVVSPDFVFVDRPRLEVLLPLVVFDVRRTIESTPSWATLQEAFASMPVDVPVSPAPEPDEVMVEWEAEVRAGRPAQPLRIRAAADPQATSPCDGCSAHCCDTITFPLTAPASMASLDYLRFGLGFPGVELGLSDSGWMLAVKTRCRHFADGRCGVYGQAERPLTCSYYDEHHCTVKVNYGTTNPAGYLRVRLEHLTWLEEIVQVDELGAVVGLPTTQEVRQHVEARMSEQATSDATPDLAVAPVASLGD